MNRAGTFRCTLLTPTALVAVLVSACAGRWWNLALAIVFVAFDLRITITKDGPA